MQATAKIIGETVKARRAEMGKSQAELAEALGIDLRTVQNVEAGDTIPAGATLYRIAHVMNLSIDRMFFPVKNEGSKTSAMVLRRLSECSEYQEKIILATINAMLEKE